MISVFEAERLIMETAKMLPIDTVDIRHAVGRVLREELKADRDFPPFDRVAMDGIALRYEDFQNGIRNFRITGLQAAGKPQIKSLGQGTCLEVMTGAMLPEGTDTVIRYEDITLANGHAIIELDAIHLRQNIHGRATDRQQGDILARPGVRISSAEIGVAATVGKSKLLVSAVPKVAVISSGDELVPIDHKPLPHQIRQSNVHSLGASLRQWGAGVSCHHVVDNKAEIRKTLAELLDANDALVLSGGVSMGKLDYFPEVLEELGVKKIFHRIAQRPGKPFWFGQKENGAVVFALPGNPASSFMCLHRYFYPWMQRCRGMETSEVVIARLSEDFSFKPSLTYFLQVNLHFDTDGVLWAKPCAGGGSGDLANLVDTNAFLELPAEPSNFLKGQSFRVWKYR